MRKFKEGSVARREPIMLILAAGMGSRYGGLKQIDPVGPHGEIIIDYSVFDAVAAGFKRFIFIIKEENREVFDEVLLSHLPKELDLQVVYQDLEDVPEGFAIPEGREKPWGTTHAIYSARDLIDAPFAVINSDDYYGREAFVKLYNFLKEEHEPNHHAMVGFKIRNTLTEHGSVSRGVCRVADDHLVGIVERKKVYKDGDDALFEDVSGAMQSLSGDTIVSMNFWGFQEAFMEVIAQAYEHFFAEEVQRDPLKAEALLPEAVGGELKKEDAILVDVFTSDDAWLGVTYHEDRAPVVQGFQSLVQDGVYPSPLWK